jgi:hypothetical protein
MVEGILYEELFDPFLRSPFMKPNWKSFLLVTALSATTGTALPSAQASTELPMDISMSEGMFNITVPDSNTTRSAYGGRLRVYDVHIAKMFEVTYQMCQTGQLGGSTVWTYAAGNGRIPMGNFTISCKLSSDIAIAYGLGRPERTVIERFTEGYGSRTEVKNVSILDITGGKVDRWMSFTRRFQPSSF